MPTELAFAPSDFRVEWVEVEVADGFTHQLVAEGVIDWDPEEGEPRIDLRVEVEAKGHRSVQGHLIFRGVGEEVLWSGRFGGIMLTPASGEVVVSVPMGRGDLASQDIRSLALVWPVAIPSARLPRVSAPTIREGESLTLQVVTDGGPESPRVLFSSSNPDVLAVSPDGTVTALLPGEATIVAVVGRHRASLTIRVTQRVDQVVVTPEAVEHEALGLDASFSAVVLDPRGDEIPGRTLTWTTDSPILEATGVGVFVGRATGTAVVTAEVDGVVGMATVVIRQQVASLTLTPESWEATALGEATTLEARALDATEHEVEGAEYLWEVDLDGVVTLDGDGTITAVGVGTASVTVSVDDLSASTQVSVRQVIHEVRVSPEQQTLLPGQFGFVQWGLFDRNENPIPDEGRTTLRSTDVGVADVDPNGMVIANNPGTAGVVAEAEGVMGTATVVVDFPAPPAAGDIYVFNDWNIWDTGANSALLAQNLVNSANNNGTRVIWYCGRQPTGVNSGSWIFGGICASSITATAGGQFAGTANAIRDAGYTVEVVYDTPLTSIPDDVRVFWLWTPTEALTNAEINLLKAFASRGGRIVWNADFRDDWYFTHKHQSIATPLLSALGTGIVSTGDLVGTSFTLGPSSFLDPSDPLLQGITSISFGHPGDMQVSAPGTALVTHLGKILIARSQVDVTPLPTVPIIEAQVGPLSLPAPAGLSAQQAPIQLPPGCVPGHRCTPP